MKHLLVLGTLFAAILVPAASAAPAATHSLRGTVVAKDRAHHALVVALPNGHVQTLVAPGRSLNTHLGRRVVIRYTSSAGRLSTALEVVVKGKTDRAVVRGTILRIARRQAIVNAGGTALDVNLMHVKAAQRQRSLASVGSGPKVGDEIEAEVEIDDDGSLDAKSVVVGSGPAAAAGAELEVRGKVTTLTQPSAAGPGVITLDVRGLAVSCSIPVGATLDVKIGDMVELTCDAVGDPAKWTVRAGHGENAKGEHDDHGDDNGSESDEHAGKVEVRGTIAPSFTQLDTVVTVKPDGGGADVVCAIVAGSLSGFAAGDIVKMECETASSKLTLREIEKVTGNGTSDDEDDGDDDHGDDGNDD
jgi:hypothetical protein